MSFLYPTQSSPYPFVILTNSDDNEDEDDVLPPSAIILSQSIPIPIASLSNLIQSNDENQYRIRLNVEGFQANELHIFIRHGRVVVHGKHFTPTPTPLLTTNSTRNHFDENESDFIAKEFKRTFIIPPNVDIQKARAQFYSDEQLLIIEIPFEHSLVKRNARRSINIFLTFVIILLIDRAIRITYEQFLLSQQQ